MTRKALSVLRSRAAQAGQQVADALESGVPAAELDDLRKRRDLLEDLVRRAQRRSSLMWCAVAVAVALVAAVILRYGFHLRRADVVLIASTNAFTFQNGPNQVLLNPTAIVASEIGSSLAPLRRPWCVKGDVSGRTCELVQSLRLNGLLVNPHAIVTLRATGRCFELMVSHGTVEAAVTAFVPPSQQAPADHPIPRTEALKLTEGHTLRACAIDEVALQAKGITSLTLGDQTEGGVAERESYPALIKGTLFLGDVNRAIELRRTDVPRIRGLTESALVVRLRDSFELTVLANATAIAVDGRGERTEMPSRLEWLRNNATIQGAFAIAAAVVAGVFAMRKRLLDEI